MKEEERKNDDPVDQLYVRISRLEEALDWIEKSVGEIKSNMATKTDIESLRHEMSIYKWAILILVTLLSALFTAFFSLI